MKKTLRPLFSLSGQSLAYGMGVYGRQVVIYLSLPFLTSLMTQQEYGAISIITSFYTVVNTLTNVGLPSATFRIYNDSENSAHRNHTLGSSQLLFFSIAGITAILIFIFSKYISLLLMGSSDFSDVIRVVALLLIFDTLNTYGNILLRLQVRPLAMSVQSLIFIISQMGLAISLIYFFDYGVIGYWLGYLFGAVVGLSLMIWLNRHFLVFEVSSFHVKELLRYGMPLVPATFSLNVLRLTDRFFIRTYLSLEQVAIFSIGYKIGSLVNVVIAPFRVAWPNFAFTTMNKERARRTYRDVVTFLLSGSLYIALVVFTLREELIGLLAPSSYQGASSVVLFIALSMVAYGVYPILSLGPKIKKETHHLAWISITVTLINIVLNLILVPSLGILGVALATFIGYSILAGISYWISQRLYRFPLDWNRLGKLGFSLVITVLIIEIALPTTQNLWFALSIKLAGLLIYPILLLLLKFIALQEMIDIFRVAKKFVQNWREVKAK